MNEDKVMQIIVNLKKFNSELMDLNIKYAEEIERLKERINNALKYLKEECLFDGKSYCSDLCYGDIPELVNILNGEKNENNSISK